MLQTPTYRPCPACDGTKARPIAAYSPADWQVASCDACDFVFLRNPPAYEALEEDFAWEKTYEAKKAKGGSTPASNLARKVRQVLRLNRQHFLKFHDWFPGDHVLDVGCGGHGHIPEPFIPYGIELSLELHAQSDAYFKTRGGYCLQGPGAETIWKFEENQFDGIVMNSYLEHEAEPLHVLNGAARALRPGGRMFVRVPNYASLNRKIIGAKWCGFRHPDHVNYFTPQSLRRLAAKAGFTVQITNPLTLPIDDNINALLEPAS